VPAQVAAHAVERPELIRRAPPELGEVLTHPLRRRSVIGGPKFKEGDDVAVDLEVDAQLVAVRRGVVLVAVALDFRDVELWNRHAETIDPRSEKRGLCQSGWC